MQDEFLCPQKLLNKTIGFITHDFDVAIRIAVRIGIMKDGVDEQFSTTEDLVTCPAIPCVAESTRRVSHDRLLSVRAYMTPVSSLTPEAAAAHAQVLLASVACQVLSLDRPVDIVDDSGTLSCKRLIDALYDREPCA